MIIDAPFVDINECLEGMHNCSRHARCTNLPDGGYNCECIVGFEGNGEICTCMLDLNGLIFNIP